MKPVTRHSGVARFRSRVVLSVALAACLLAAHPAVVAWTKGTRLSPMSGLGPYRDHPLVVQTRDKEEQIHAAGWVYRRKS